MLMTIPAALELASRLIPKPSVLILMVYIQDLPHLLHLCKEARQARRRAVDAISPIGSCFVCIYIASPPPPWSVVGGGLGGVVLSEK